MQRLAEFLSVKAARKPAINMISEIAARRNLYKLDCAPPAIFSLNQVGRAAVITRPQEETSQEIARGKSLDERETLEVRRRSAKPTFVFTRNTGAKSPHQLCVFREPVNV